MDLLLKYVGDELEKLLSEKTGWSRNEVMNLFYKAWVLGMAKYAREKRVQID
jgi:hypothetical protein